jgi:hypothetical protein
MGAVFDSYLIFPPLVVISPLLHAHFSPHPEVCGRPDHAGHYCVLKLRWGGGFICEAAFG